VSKLQQSLSVCLCDTVCACVHACVRTETTQCVCPYVCAMMHAPLQVVLLPHLSLGMQHLLVVVWAN
jgi:hypothetical protein